jgi:hypothetical protein
MVCHRPLPPEFVRKLWYNGEMASTPNPRRLRFNLRFVLFWVIPYVALAAALTTWSGPYASEFLNRHARLSLLIGLTVLWVTLYASRRATQQGRERRDEEIAAPDPSNRVR